MTIEEMVEFTVNSWIGVNEFGNEIIFEKDIRLMKKQLIEKINQLLSQQRKEIVEEISEWARLTRDYHYDQIAAGQPVVTIESYFKELFELLDSLKTNRT